jgi:hypothetical protein
MLTYVAGSRSLEIGNDYLGTCPYAFLIHVLAMHNEFLARDHEKRTADAISQIGSDVERLDKDCAGRGAEPYCAPTDAIDIFERSRQIESQINQLKHDSYNRYERHRYLNIFRYDTEGKVFAKMAELRGTDWRGQAMDKALETLEEYAADIDRRQTDADRKQAELDRIAAEKERMAAEERREMDRLRREEEKAREEQRGRRFGVLLGGVGVVSGIGVVFNMADWIANRTVMGAMPSAGSWASFFLGNLAFALSCVGFAILGWLGWPHLGEAWRWLRSRGQSHKAGATGPAPATPSLPMTPIPGSPPTGSP